MPADVTNTGMADGLLLRADGIRAAGIEKSKL